MEHAIVTFSRNGDFKSKIAARDIASREHYRKLWPLVTPDKPHRLVTWVRPVFDAQGNLRKRSHFRRLSLIGATGLGAFQKRSVSTLSESREHAQAKQLIAAELSRRLDERQALPWAYTDSSISQYPLNGNLLQGVSSVSEEQQIHAPFGVSYRLDVALMGPPILRHPMILAGIEIEYGHAFDGVKALAARVMGFPLISIDITDMALDALTPSWARRALTDTTSATEDGRRRSYVYLNDLLYPRYLKLPPELMHGDDIRHQFIVFAADAELERYRKILFHVLEALGFTRSQVPITLANAKSVSATKHLENLGSIVGPDWAQYNSSRCLTITLSRVRRPDDLSAHLLHIAIATLLAEKGTALVGYKSRLGNLNDHPEEDVWRDYRKGVWHHVLPKLLGEPFGKRLELINKLLARS